MIINGEVTLSKEESVATHLELMSKHQLVSMQINKF
jgi:hypothetical protein